MDCGGFYLDIGDPLVIRLGHTFVLFPLQLQIPYMYMHTFEAFKPPTFRKHISGTIFPLVRFLNVLTCPGNEEYTLHVLL